MKAAIHSHDTTVLTDCMLYMKKLTVYSHCELHIL